MFLTCHRESQGSSSSTGGCHSFEPKPPLCPINHDSAEPCAGSFSKLSFYSPTQENSPGAPAPPEQQQSCFPWAVLGSGRFSDPFCPWISGWEHRGLAEPPRFSKGAESVPQAPLPGVHSPIRPGSPSLSTLGGNFGRVGSQRLLPLFRASKSPS